MAAMRSMAPMPFLLPILFITPMPKLTPMFWVTVSFLVPLEFTAMIFYMKALKVSEMSLSVPMLAFSPSFIIITGWLILGESVNLRGFLGVMSTVCGAYILHLGPRDIKGGFLAPIRSLATHKGARYMLVVAILYSVTSCLGKRAIQLSSPLFFAPFYFTLLGILFPAFYLIYSRDRAFREYKDIFAKSELVPLKMVLAVAAIGILQAIMVYSHMIAISLANAAYMIAVKRTSLLFSILFGATFFRERPMTPRLIGGSLMLLGVSLVITTKGG